MTKHPTNRAERLRLKSLARSKFKDHVHLNEEKRYIKNRLEERETQDAVTNYLANHRDADFS